MIRHYYTAGGWWKTDTTTGTTEFAFSPEGAPFPMETKWLAHNTTYDSDTGQWVYEEVGSSH